MPAYILIEEGVRASLDQSMDFQIEYFMEYMDRYRFTDTSYKKNLLDLYRTKYADKKIDLILTNGYHALEFAVAHGDEIFPQTPVFFATVLETQVKRLKLNHRFTGALVQIDYLGLLNTALNNHPDTRHVAIIAGTSKVSRLIEAQIRKAYASYANKYDMTSLGHLPMRDILDRLAKLPKHTVVLYYVLARDGKGEAFKPWKVAAMISEAANVPVYGMSDTYLGTGIVGGALYSFGAAGRKAGEIGLRILKGENPADIPVSAEGIILNMFDWRQLKRWGISESDLPEGSIVRYKEWSFWDLYRWYILGGIFLFFIQGFFIISLVVQRKRGKQTEQSLHQAEQKHRTVADFTYDWEYWESPKGKMLYVSPSCERISGYPAESFMNNPGLMQEIILRDDRGIWADHRHKARTKSGPLGIEFRIRTKDGEIRWIDHVCQPVHDAVGKFLGSRGSNRDVTKRKFAENELKRKEKMLEDAQSIARLGSWEWDILTNRLEWSDEVYRIFGLSPQAFGATYEAFLESVHPDDHEDVKGAVNQALSDPSFDYNIVHRIRRPDGSERIVRERGKMTFDDNTGKASRMIGTVQDITDIRKIENEAEKLRVELSHMDRLSTMGVLTAGIAHEINQPLAAILSNAQAALRFLTSDQQDLYEVKEALRDIIYDDKRAGEMVHSIRNIAGKYDLKREKIDLNETVKEILVLIKSEALNRRIFLSENLQPDIPPVYGDRIQIQQVIINLVMNALEALKGHHISTPEVIVSTQLKEDQDVILCVSDSGPGIGPDQLNAIFDSFQTTKKGGLGIGLSICRSIAKKHGGHIWAENRPEGGAAFFFRLPFGEEGDE